MIYYKVRSKDTGKYFKNRGFNGTLESGKIWTTLGKLRTSITLMTKYHYSPPNFSDWEIVEFEVKEVAVKDVHEIVTAKTLVRMLSK